MARVSLRCRALIEARRRWHLVSCVGPEMRLADVDGISYAPTENLEIEIRRSLEDLFRYCATELHV